LRECSIHVRHHRLLKYEVDLAEFHATPARTLGEQISVVDEFGEQVAVRAIAHAQQIIEALQRSCRYV
jgi:hypothetical protein